MLVKSTQSVNVSASLFFTALLRFPEKYYLASSIWAQVSTAHQLLLLQQQLQLQQPSKSNILYRNRVLLVRFSCKLGELRMGPSYSQKENSRTYVYLWETNRNDGGGGQSEGRSVS